MGVSIEDVIVRSECCYLTMTSEVCRFCLVRSGVTLEIRFERDEQGLQYLLRTLGMMASAQGGAEISWLEAAVLSQWIRENVRENIR